MERRIIADYNKDEPYVKEARTLTEKKIELNTSENKSYLFPKYKGEKSRYNSDEDKYKQHTTPCIINCWFYLTWEILSEFRSSCFI
jgi:hypothetical protein